MKLNTQSRKCEGKYVAYWVQASQRTIYNHALEFAIDRANQYNVPLICFFGLTANYPNANQRPYYFMLQGLQQLEKAFKERGIKFIIVQESPDEVAIKLSKEAQCLVMDRGYLRIQRTWRKRVAESINCECYQIESEVLVPVESASNKEEYAAKTIRPKITKLISHFAVPMQEEKLNNSSVKMNFDSYDISDIERVINDLKVDKSVSVVREFTGGQEEAQATLREFLDKKLGSYGEDRNDPSKNGTSNLSPYLHFGMISPLQIYLETMSKCKKSESRDSFLEELIVRRELSMNFCFYNMNYDKFSCLPNWAVKTLQEHATDKREYCYSREQWEQGKTHDEYWNAAQKEAIYKGKISGYMRMYWGKKVIEWSATPEEAYETLVYLNDKYHLDGRDANGYTGVAWCFGKHGLDRPWATRKIFGMVRYMADSGLKRKFDSGKYVAIVEKEFKRSRMERRTVVEEGEEAGRQMMKKQLKR